MKIHIGDTVIVLAGKDKGKKGKAQKVFPKSQTVLIESINIYKRHIKKNEQMPQGGIVELPRPLSVSNVAIYCSKCKKETKVGYEIKGEKKNRICRRCKSLI